MKKSVIKSNSTFGISVQHVGDDQFVVRRVTDPNAILPRWIKPNMELTAGEAAALNREYGNNTVRY